MAHLNDSHANLPPTLIGPFIVSLTHPMRCHKKTLGTSFHAITSPMPDFERAMVTKPLGGNHYRSLIIQITLETNSGSILFFYAMFLTKASLGKYRLPSHGLPHGNLSAFD